MSNAGLIITYSAIVPSIIRSWHTGDGDGDGDGDDDGDDDDGDDDDDDDHFDHYQLSYVFYDDYYHHYDDYSYNKK